MDATKILHADLLDIIFEGRNKTYGAYELRRTYPQRIKYAMIGMGVAVATLITGMLLASSSSSKSVAYVTPDIFISDVNQPKQEKVEIPVQPKPQVQQVRTLAVTIPRIVKNNEVEHTEVPPVDETIHANISTFNQEGIDKEIVKPPVEQATTSKSVLPVGEDESTKIFTIVQSEAKFPGGAAEWSKFLEHNLEASVATDNGAPAGKYTVQVSFLVDKDGNISEIKAVNDPGYGIAQEAMRVIKKSRQWIPAIQNGRNVIYRQTQAITFVVNAE